MCKAGIYLERLNYHELVAKLAAINRRLGEMGIRELDRMRVHEDNISELAVRPTRIGWKKSPMAWRGRSVAKSYGLL